MENLSHYISLGLSKSCCYEQPFNVIGIEKANGQKLAPTLRHVDR